MKRLVARSRARLRQWITRGGLLFTLAIVLVGLAAAASANNLLFLILATMLSVMLISGLISRLTLAGLELDFAMPEHVAAGRTVAGTLAVRNVKSWMPSFSIRVAGAGGTADRPAILNSEVYFPIIPGGATLEESIDVRFPRRGAYTQNSFAFSTRFPFGFREKTVLVELNREIVVYPSIDPEPGFEALLSALSGEIDAHLRGRGSDFYRIRPYEAFESARYFDWKATAHTGQPQVREFSREQERSVEIFLDRAVPPDHAAWFERAVNCCAYLAWRLVRQQEADLRFRSQGFRLRVPEEGNVYEVLRFLALAGPARDPEPPAPLDESSYQIVFSALPQRFQSLNWPQARVVGPGSPPA
jgi:uncharacterized protein (DUF58 family)